MPEFITYLTEGTVLGIDTWRLAIATFIIFLSFLARFAVRLVFKSVLASKARQSDAEWDDEIVNKIPAPLGAFIQLVIWYFAVLILQLPEEPVHLTPYLLKGLEVAAAFAMTWLLLRIIDVVSNASLRAAAKTDSRLDDQLIPLIRKTVKTVVCVLVIVQIIQNLGYSITSVLAGLGVGGLALALAAQDTVANLFGSLVVFADKPFQMGDWIECNGVEGTVEEVGFRTTRVRKFDKSLVILPNSTFSSNPITNFSSRPIRRIDMVVGLTYETSSSQMQLFLKTVRELIKNHNDIDQKFNFVHFVEFNASSLDVRIYCFTKSTVWVKHLEAQEDIMLKVMDICEEQGLEIAFQTQTIYWRDEKWKEQKAA